MKQTLEARVGSSGQGEKSSRAVYVVPALEGLGKWQFNSGVDFSVGQNSLNPFQRIFLQGGPR